MFKLTQLGKRQRLLVRDMLQFYREHTELYERESIAATLRLLAFKVNPTGLQEQSANLKEHEQALFTQLLTSAFEMIDEEGDKQAYVLSILKPAIMIVKATRPAAF